MILEQTKGLVIPHEPKVAVLAPPVANYYLLVIGIDHYKKEPLNNPVRDANELVKTLTTNFTFTKPPNAEDLRTIDDRYAAYETAIPVYRDIKTMCLYNEEATPNAIKTHIDAVYDKIEKNDAFLIFFSGHGRVKGNYQIMVFNDASEQTDVGYSISGLYDSFPRFDEKCRHLLVVLDSCFAGTANIGPVNQDAGLFSRYIATSCQAGQEALDGYIQIGSPFAVYMEGKLRNSLTKITELNPAFFKGFEQGLETNHDQQITYGTPPGSSSGPIFFPLMKRDVSRPDLAFLRNSFIDDLDFDKQRLSLNEYYRQSCNHLNIITTQSSSFNIRNVFAKIFFRWLSDPDNGKLFGSDAIIKEEVIRLETLSEEHIWNRVAENISLTDPIQDQAGSIVTWFFEQLITDSPFEGKQRVILWVEIKSGGAHFASVLDAFCIKFSQLFLEKYNQLPRDEKDCLGKLFIFISDESAGGDWQRDTFLLRDQAEKLNFITTDRINPIINRNYFIHWRRKIEDNEAELLQILKKNEVLKELFGANQWGDFSCSYDEFILKICAHCGFSEEEIKSEFVSYIYGFNKWKL